MDLWVCVLQPEPEGQRWGGVGLSPTKERCSTADLIGLFFLFQLYCGTLIVHFFISLLWDTDISTLLVLLPAVALRCWL